MRDDSRLHARDFEAIRRELADSYDEELELSFDEDHDDGDTPPRRTYSANCSGSSTSWSACRIG
jgi:hypothetical protein